jgi:hypothetical protein
MDSKRGSISFYLIATIVLMVSSLIGGLTLIKRNQELRRSAIGERFSCTREQAATHPRCEDPSPKNSRWEDSWCVLNICPYGDTDNNTACSQGDRDVIITYGHCFNTIIPEVANLPPSLCYQFDTVVGENNHSWCNLGHPPSICTGYQDNLDTCSAQTPTSTPTPIPPTSTPTPNATSTPTPKLKLTSTPTPKPTSTPRPTNTPTGTLVPTNTPTNTPIPTNTPVPTNTPNLVCGSDCNGNLANYCPADHTCSSGKCVLISCLNGSVTCNSANCLVLTPSVTGAPTNTSAPIAQGPSPTRIILPQTGLDFPLQGLTIIGAIVTLAGFLILL